MLRDELERRELGKVFGCLLSAMWFIAVTLFMEMGVEARASPHQRQWLVLTMGLEPLDVHSVSFRSAKLLLRY